MTTVPTSVGICHKIGPFPGKRPEDKPRHACLYADYPSNGNPADDELEANARLIAAAPELLDCLEEAMSMLGDRLIKDVFGYEWHEKAAQAIAKATNQQGNNHD